MICKKCGYDNDQYTTVCMKCGEPLTAGYLMCPNCGKTIKEDEKVCPRCKETIFVHDIKVNETIIHEAYTPKYIISDFLSFPAIIGIAIFMIYSFGFNLGKYIKDLIQLTSNKTVSLSIGILLGQESRVLILIPLIIISIYTLVYRFNINKKTELEVLKKRLNTFKSLYIADVTGFFTYFFTSYWIFVFDGLAFSKPFIYYLGAFIGLILFLISVISIPFFYKKAKIITR